MSEIIVAKIQNRRGQRVNLPQPLDPGEIGLCLDTGQMFIGADADDPNSIISPVVEVFTPSTQSNDDANEVIDLQILQIDLDDPIPENTGSSDPVGDVEQEIADTAGVPVEQVKVVIYDDDTRAARAYVSYMDPATIPPEPPEIPSELLDQGSGEGIYGPTQWFGYISGNDFIDGVLALSQAYITEDANAIAELINIVYNQGDSNGLVTVKQNIEVLTEYFDLNLPSDLILDPLEFELSARAGFGPVTNLDYNIDVSDAFDISYSVKGDSGADLTRTGKFTIAADSDEANLMDQATEINPNSESVDFIAQSSGGTVSIHYRSSVDIIFRTITRRWKSF